MPGHMETSGGPVLTAWQLAPPREGGGSHSAFYGLDLEVALHNTLLAHRSIQGGTKAGFGKQECTEVTMGTASV